MYFLTTDEVVFSILYYIEILVAQREAKRDVVLCVLVFTLKEHSKAQATQSTIDLDREIKIFESNSYSTVGLGQGWTTLVFRGAAASAGCLIFLWHLIYQLISLIAERTHAWAHVKKVSQSRRADLGSGPPVHGIPSIMI